MQSSPSGQAEPTPQRASWLAQIPYAHRGLHGRGIVENSRAAFDAAIARGHGIELDVQASMDGTAFVFHDERLDRLTGQRGAIGERRGAELQSIALRGTAETIPTLAEILERIAGRTPLLIEIKARRGGCRALCRAVAGDIAEYPGLAAVMSFNPEVGAWFARHAPAPPRGLVVTESGKRGWRGKIGRHLALARARPDFLAYDVRDLPSSFAARVRSVERPLLTWTVYDAPTRHAAAAHADQIIYEDR